MLRRILLYKFYRLHADRQLINIPLFSYPLLVVRSLYFSFSCYNLDNVVGIFESNA